MTPRIKVVDVIIIAILSVCYVSAHVLLDKEIHTVNNNYVTIADIIRYQREKINEEMRFLEYQKDFENIDALTPETNGKPFRNIIITTWRSGSTFLGEILNSIPGTYYHFEPLVNYGIINIRGPPNDQPAINQLKNLLNCNYTSLNDYLDFGAKNKFVFSYNTRLWNYCHLHRGHPNNTGNPSHPDDPRYCTDPKFLSSFCKLFPIQTMKVMRLRLALAEQLLEDPNLNVRIIFLVRDPRALMQSRKHCEWCDGNPDCEHTPTVCNDMVSDYYSATNLQIKYPHKFKAVRYEELSLNPFEVTEEILKFYGLPFDRKVVKFLESHTKKDIGHIYSTYRDSSLTPFRWMRNLTNKEINDIQISCSKSMDLWGYKKMHDHDMYSVKEFNPLLPWPFP